MSATKVCTGPCGRTLPADEKHFYKMNRHGDLRPNCIACYNAGRTDHGKIRSVADIPKGRTRPTVIAPEKPIIKVKREEITKVEEHRLKVENRALRESNETLVKQLAEGGEYNELIRDAMAACAGRPHIKPRERKSQLREGAPLVIASDWHVEQEVLPERVAYRNRFNLTIARQRIQRFFEAIRWAIKQQRDTYKIRDLILAMLGDFIQNFLHEDDIENNLLTPLQAILWIQPELIAGFEFLLQDPELEQVIIPLCDGNHGRDTKKMRASTRTAHSLEVVVYAQLALHFRNEPRLRFVMPTSQFTFLDDVYGKTIRFLHGDVFKFAGGVGGITVPLFRAMARWEKTKHADLTCMGHWHQRYCLPDVMVNGSLIGYDGFAMSIGAPFEPPVQSLRMLDARRWTGADIPLYVSVREDDRGSDPDVFAKRSQDRAAFKKQARSKVPHYLRGMLPEEE